MMNGVSLSSMIGGGWGGGAIPNATGLQEMVFDTASVSAELATGGVRINFIAREGGNELPRLDLRQLRERLLPGDQHRRPTFWRETRHWPTPAASTRTGTSTRASAVRSSGTSSGSSPAAAIRARTCSPRGCSTTQNANNPARWDYVADTQPASLDRESVEGRTDAPVVAGVSQEQDRRHLHAAETSAPVTTPITATVAPEAANDRRFPMQRVVLVDWTSPVTNRTADRSQRHPSRRALGQHAPADEGTQPRSADDRRGRAGREPFRACDIGAQSETHGANRRHLQQLLERQLPLALPRLVHHRLARLQGRRERRVSAITRTPRTSRIRCRTGSTTACRTRSSLRALPHTVKNHVDHGPRPVRAGQVDDRPSDGIGWHPLRPSCQPASPSRRSGPTFATPTRNITFPEQRQPELARHHAKESGGLRPVRQREDGAQGQPEQVPGGSRDDEYECGLSGLDWQQSDQRAQHRRAGGTGPTRNRNFVPDCDLLSRWRRTIAPAAATSARPFDDATFGLATPNTRFDPDLLTGWGKRSYNWEFSTERAARSAAAMSRSTWATSGAGTGTSSSPTT